MTLDLFGGRQMSTTQLSDTLDGLFAYDSGATDSGIHDEELRATVVATLKAMDDDSFRRCLSMHVRDHYLTDEAIAEGYGIEDVKNFIEWLADEMKIDI